jgi:hypothetical protein
MIRFQRLSQPLLDSWLVDQQLGRVNPRYLLRVWRENRAGLNAIRQELQNYIDEGFEDARKRIRRGFEDQLSPFRNPPQPDPAANYPALLNRKTLQGYFGETLAAIAIEHWGAHGHCDWAIPAFLFRFHDQEFQHLDEIYERLANDERYDPDNSAEIRPGRTGDDGLAFRINAQNRITDMIVIEAKCVNENRTTTIAEAHQKLSSSLLQRSGIRELINILQEYDTPTARVWHQALLELWFSSARSAAVRHDCVGYACGQIPARGGRISWMPQSSPNQAYTANRNLECMEFQFGDINTIINTIYRGE